MNNGKLIGCTQSVIESEMNKKPHKTHKDTKKLI